MVSAERRFHRRERGATLFVVVLAITLLTGVGLYSLHSSALVARASGNQREARQTTYLAELGTLIMLSEIAKDPAALYTGVRSMTTPPQCRNNLGYVTTGKEPPFCYQVDQGDIVLPTGAAVMASDSFGPYSDIVGRFNIELTDVAPGPWAIAGEQMSSDGFQYLQGKLTTVAQLERAGAGAACVANMMPIAGQHVTRAHVVMGPVKLQQ
jgi:hypothetical protein